MATRTNSSEVKQIISTSVDPLPFIKAASIIVDRISDRDEDGDLSTNDLREIERWVAAHLIASTRDPAVMEDRTGDTTVKYFLGTPGKGLEMTPYGQQAMLLDVTGRLASMGKPRASIKAIDLDL